jgi:ABC-type molybdate transport system ATPase subunit
MISQQEAINILENALTQSNKDCNNADLVYLVGEKMFQALNSCQDWRKDDNLKFKDGKVFYKKIEVVSVKSKIQ